MIRRPTGWERAASTSHASEVAFQDLVQEVFPKVLASQFDGQSVVAREVQTPDGGRIDVVSIDEAGIVTLCECKLERNAGSRREVLGQVLEYGGALLDMDFDEFARRVGDRLGSDLVSAMRDTAPDDFDEDRWRATVEQQLRTGKFRLLIAVDQITPALRRTILFLNERCDFPLVAAELRYVKEGATEMIVPRLYGDEAADRKLSRRTTSSPTVRDPDVVIVPATKALKEYQALGAYICQPHRTFRTVSYLGFYWNRQIEPVFPAAVGFFQDVPFTTENAAALRENPDPAMQRVGEIVAAALAAPDNDRKYGEHYQVVPLLLDDDHGFRLAAPIRHNGSSAWTQNQRYATAAALRTEPATTDDLAEAEG